MGGLIGFVAVVGNFLFSDLALNMQIFLAADTIGDDLGFIMKKFLHADYSAASNRVYASLIDLRSNGIFIIDFNSGASSRDLFR